MIAKGHRGEIIYRAALFCLAAAMITIYINPINPVSMSGDAASIWASIKALANGELLGSYVMYKGVLSCYPYVWLYQLSQLLQLSEFFFMKVYHVLLFAYASAIALPGIYERLFRKTAPRLRRLLLVIILFLFWRSTCIFDQLMIDLPSMACFLASVKGALDWNAMGKDFPKWRVLLLFGLLGLGFCFSGQYSIATLLLCIYCAITANRLRKEQAFRSAGWKLTWILALVLLLLPRVFDAHFMNTVVEPLVAAGEWLPSKSFWLWYGLTNTCMHYAQFLPTLQSPVGHQIYGVMSAVPEIVAETQVGLPALPYIFLIWLQHPLEMLQLWCNRLFLALSTDGMCRNALYLLIGYLCLYVTLLLGVRRVRRWRDLFCKESLIYLAFLFSILVSCALHMESRFAISIQGLILTIGLLHDTLWDGLKAAVTLPCRMKKGREGGPDISAGGENAKPGIHYAVIFGVLFILMCFIHYGTLMELQVMEGVTDFFYTFQIW